MKPKFPYTTVTTEIIGLHVDPKDKEDIESINEAKALIKSINIYLEGFCVAEKDLVLCPNCHSKLGDLLGSFTWGMVHGSGSCRQCGWPCQACHNIKDEHGPIFNPSINIILPIHPKFVEKK